MDEASRGEGVVRGPWLTQSYYKEAHNSETLWRGGYVHTGDVGAIDDNGYLQITDRIKDVIKSGGEWISSLDVEDILLQHSSISEAAVVGVADERWGERPLALGVSKSPLTQGDGGGHSSQFATPGAISQRG